MSMPQRQTCWHENCLPSVSIKRQPASRLTSTTRSAQIRRAGFNLQGVLASAGEHEPLRQKQSAAAVLSSVALFVSGPAIAVEDMASHQAMPHQVMTSAQSVTSHLPLGLLFKPADISGEPKIVYSNFHELKADDIDGKEVNFADLNGKDFATLQQTFAGKDVAIVAFPCNQFLNQEPGSNADIKQFAKNKGFKGLLMDKIDVNGSEASPVYAYLKDASGDTSPIPWNFAKFLVRKDGTVYGRYGPKSTATELSPLIEKLLADSK